jgi:two-component system LytT family response regulator
MGAPEPERVSAVVIEDEPLHRHSLRRLIEADGRLEWVGEAGDAAAGRALLHGLQPALLFLDVELPGQNGLGLLASLPEERRPEVILTTAYERYALPAFDLDVADYLLKPFDDPRFARAVARALERLEQKHGGPRRGFLTIPREGRLERIELDDIRAILAADQYVWIQTPRGRTLYRESLSHLEQRLDPERFVRVHRSALLAWDALRVVESTGGGRGRAGVEVEPGRLLWVPVARARLAGLRARLTGPGKPSQQD